MRPQHSVFLSNVGLVILLNLLIKPLYIFGIDRTVQNTVGAEEYGLYFALLNFSFLFQIVQDLGIQNFNHVHLSKSPDELTKFLPKVLGAKLTLSLVYLLVVLGVGCLIGYSREILPLLFLIAVNHILISLSMLMRTSLSAMGHYRLDSLLSVMDKFLLILMIGGLFLFGGTNLDFDIKSFILFQMIAYFSSFLIGAILIFRLNLGIRVKFGFDLTFYRWLLQRTIPFALVLVLMTLYTRMDAVMLERMLGEQGPLQAGIYAASYRLLDAANMAGVLVAGLLLPMFAKNLQDTKAIASLASSGFKMLWSVSLLVVGVGFFFSDDIMRLLYIEANDEWSDVFSILILSYLASSATYIFGTLLTAGEFLGPMNRVFLGGVLVNFLLNYFLIPTHLAWGSAVATVITQFGVSLLLIRLCLKHFKLITPMSHVVKGLLLTIGILLWISLMAVTPIAWELQVLLAMLGGGSIALIFGFLPFRTLIPKSILP